VSNHYYWSNLPATLVRKTADIILQCLTPENKNRWESRKQVSEPGLGYKAFYILAVGVLIS
jgi:hypothetical protein